MTTIKAMTVRLDSEDYRRLNRQASKLGTKPASLARMLVKRGLQEPAGKTRRPGSAKDEVLWIAPDFDETPEEFKDYT